MFDERKVAQAAAYLISKRGGKMSHLKLMKLLYFADREALCRFGVAISGDQYFSLRNGPVLSKTLNLMAGMVDSAPGGWESYISDKEDHQVELIKPVSRDDLDELSDADIEILNDIWARFGTMNRWEIVEYSHNKENVPEWNDPNGSRLPIEIESILKGVGKTHAQIEDDMSAIDARNRIDRLFASLKR